MKIVSKAIAFIATVAIFNATTTGATTTSAPNTTLYNMAVETIGDMMDSVTGFEPLALRLAFHDCVGSDGCDGCLNTDQSDNAGLLKVVLILNKTKNDDSTYDTVSNADFWQIAGIVALQRTNTYLNDSTYSITFKGGREDCDTTPYDTTNEWNYPDAAWNYTEMMAWYSEDDDGFSMNETYVTALMGAHSLGLCTTDNSGYDGDFTTAPGTFDNDYFKYLYDYAENYTNVANEPNSTDDDYKYQWEWTDNDIMFLNTDIELVYDIDTDNSGDGTTCTISSSQTDSTVDYCSESDMRSTVKTYAEDEEAWLVDYIAAHEWFMEIKNSGLTTPSEND